MPGTVKLVIAIAVSALPLNALRTLGYRAMGYDIRGSRIGLGTVINVDRATIRDARVGPLNLFNGPIEVVIEPGATIGNRNEFSSGDWVADPANRDAGYGRFLRIGAGANITCRHFFDVAGRLEIGERTWIAGLGSQFWTHGAGAADRDVVIGADCYVGSVVRFAPGSSIGNEVIVAMGSVVTGAVRADRALVAGVPARVTRADYDWRSRGPASGSDGERPEPPRD